MTSSDSDNTQRAEAMKNRTLMQRNEDGPRWQRGSSQCRQLSHDESTCVLWCAPQCPWWAVDQVSYAHVCECFGDVRVRVCMCVYVRVCGRVRACTCVKNGDL